MMRSSLQPQQTINDEPRLRRIFSKYWRDDLAPVLKRLESETVIEKTAKVSQKPADTDIKTAMAGLLKPLVDSVTELTRNVQLQSEQIRIQAAEIQQLRAPNSEGHQQTPIESTPAGSSFTTANASSAAIRISLDRYAATGIRSYSDNNGLRPKANLPGFSVSLLTLT